MNRALTIPANTLAAEAGWITKLRRGAGFSPALGTVQVSAVLGALQLRRTDLAQYRQTVIPAEGAGQFDVEVDAAKLAETLKTMTGPAVVDFNGKLTVAAAGTTAALRAEEVEFPAWPRFEPTDDPTAVIPAQVLARVLTSVGTDDTLPMLTAVSFDDGTMVTTDRFRMTRIAYAESGFTALVPATALRPFASGTDVVFVEPGKAGTDALVRVSCGGRSIVMAMMDHQFPKWRQLIPDESPISLVVRRDDLLAAAAGGERVTLTVREDGTMLVCTDDGVDGDLEVNREISVQLLRRDDLPFTVALRPKYLIDCLRNIGCGAVQFGASTPTKPVTFQDVSGAVLHLIMPIRT